MINNRTIYAIEALCELARCKDYSSTAQKVAESAGISNKFIPQILADLSKAGIIKSVRGYGGGVSLTKHPKNISLYSILEIAQINLFVYDAFIKQHDEVKGGLKNTLKVFKIIDAATKVELKKVSLADLAKKPRGKK